MADEDLGLVDRIVKATVDDLIVAAISLVVIGSAVAIKDGNKDTYIKAGSIFGGLCSIYGPALIYERYLERKRRQEQDEPEQTPYEEMRA